MSQEKKRTRAQDAHDEAVERKRLFIEENQRIKRSAERRKGTWKSFVNFSENRSNFHDLEWVVHSVIGRKIEEQDPVNFADFAQKIGEAFDAERQLWLSQLARLASPPQL